jgi:hypothetical protein
MKEKKENTTPKTHSNSIEPGHPDYHPGHTGIPDVAVMDEDAKSEIEYENKQPKQDTDEEERKVVNEQEQEQVVNDDEPATETEQPKEKAKMSDKPKSVVNPQER